MSLRVTDVAQAAACPKRLASLVTTGSGRVRPPRRASRSDHPREPSSREQLLGKVFEQTIQHALTFIGDEGSASYLLSVVDKLVTLRKNQRNASFGELPLGFTLEEFTERDQSLMINRKEMNKLAREVKNFDIWFQAQNNRYSWHDEVIVKGVRKQSNGCPPMALSGRIDLLGLREDGLLIVELKRTKGTTLSARVQACMYRDLMFDPQLESKDRNGNFIEVPFLSNRPEEVTSIVYHARDGERPSLEGDGFDKRVAEGRSPTYQTRPDKYVCRECHLRSSCHSAVLEGRLL